MTVFGSLLRNRDGDPFLRAVGLSFRGVGMARLVALSGKVSKVSPASLTDGSVRHGPRAASPVIALSFRVDDRPAYYKGQPIVGDGDLVTVAGLEDDGVLKALAIRNRSTGVDYGGATALQYLVLGVATLAGLLTVTVGGLGLLFLVVAGWIWSRVRRRAHALTLVRTAAPSRGARRV
jgi:hypothetical protein